jgi:gamma-glutamylaminecyclotransferase
MPLVFVYGTLMRAGANHSVLLRLGCRFASAATTREPRTLVDLGPYPALLPLRAGTPEPTTCIEGEIWEIDDSALRELDAFEGCPELYTRERIALVTPDDARSKRREVEAFVYVLARRPPAHARVITTGRYGVAGVALPEGAAPEQFDDESGDD